MAQHVEDRRIAVDEGVRAGTVCRERKGEQARDLLTSPCTPHIGFDLSQRNPADIPGPHKNRYRKSGPESLTYFAFGSGDSTSKMP
jgi:hypothetical protein